MGDFSVHLAEERVVVLCVCCVGCCVCALENCQDDDCAVGFSFSSVTPPAGFHLMKQH